MLIFNLKSHRNMRKVCSLFEDYHFLRWVESKKKKQAKVALTLTEIMSDVPEGKKNLLLNA